MGRLNPMSTTIAAQLVVQAPTLNTFRYLYRTARAAKHMPGLARMFLMHLYKQTVLGWWWLIFRALLPTVGIIAVFQHIPAIKPAGLPYALYVISGMVLWTVVSTTLLRGSRSLRRSKRLLGKMIIPKLVFVIASGSIAAVFSLIFAVALAAAIVFEYFASGILYLNLDWPLLLFPFPMLRHLPSLRRHQLFHLGGVHDCPRRALRRSSAHPILVLSSHPSSIRWTSCRRAGSSPLPTSIH